MSKSEQNTGDGRDKVYQNLFLGIEVQLSTFEKSLSNFHEIYITEINTQKLNMKGYFYNLLQNIRKCQMH